MATIITKNSSTAGAAPVAGDLVQGELAVNVTSKALYTKNASAAVVKLNTPSIVDNGDATAITIDSSENVGIGTSSPVFGNGSGLQVSRAGTATVRVTDSTDSNSIEVVADATGVMFDARGNIPMRFNNTGGERARIDSSGNLLVGTTGGSPFDSCRIAINASQEGMRMKNSNSSGGISGTMIRFLNAVNTTVGEISSTGSATTYATSSDYRLKENIAPMVGALSVVQQLKPVTYTWKATGESTQGFIAHELQAVVPECVVGEKDATRIEKYEISPAVPATYDEEGNELTPAVEAVMGEREVPAYQGIDTSFLVATLTAAIQEQQAIINAQQAALTTLTERIAALEAK